MTQKCSTCGKPFPAGQNRCNWCEPDRETAACAEEITQPAETASENDIPQSLPEPVADDQVADVGQGAGGIVAGIFMFVIRFVAVIFGLLLIVGGGLSAFCGVLTSANGGGSLVVSGLLALAFGGLAIAAACRRKSAPGTAAPKPQPGEASERSNDSI